MTRLAAALLLAAAGCRGGSPQPQFNPLPSGAATAPAPTPSVREDGGSDITLDGELSMHSSRDAECARSPDDYFVRLAVGRVDDKEVFVSLNVEFYRGPGRYAGKTQVLVRHLSDDGTYSAAWYDGHATMRVFPGRGGADLDRVTLAPDQGTLSTGKVTLEGHFACRGAVRSVRERG